MRTMAAECGIRTPQRVNASISKNAKLTKTVPGVYAPVSAPISPGQMQRNLSRHVAITFCRENVKRMNHTASESGPATGSARPFLLAFHDSARQSISPVTGLTAAIVSTLSGTIAKNQIPTTHSFSRRPIYISVSVIAIMRRSTESNSIYTVSSDVCNIIIACYSGTLQIPYASLNDSSQS